ncbi:hypothetical protein BKA56DRAFT_592726 [Ilyonectria sp. MPI-CAGE-AT-0026]|nr:hypothetical protein BKA56DRAFT_592726 [Ilyonectria sp. MPI-CAGE-AT-0026]
MFEGGFKESVPDETDGLYHWDFEQIFDPAAVTTGAIFDDYEDRCGPDQPLGGDSVPQLPDPRTKPCDSPLLRGEAEKRSNPPLCSQ